MVPSLSQPLVLRLIVMPLLRVAGRLQSWSMTLTGFCLGLTFSMDATKSGGLYANRNSLEKNGQAIITALDQRMISDEQLNDLALELLKDAKPRVLH
jgi:hypothetical protein